MRPSRDAIERRLKPQPKSRTFFNPKVKLDTSQIDDQRNNPLTKLLNTDNTDYSTHYGGDVPYGMQKYYKDNAGAIPRIHDVAARVDAKFAKEDGKKLPKHFGL